MLGVLRLPRWRPRNLDAGVVFGAWTVSSVVICGTGAVRSRAGSATATGAGSAPTSLAPPGRGCAEPPPHADRAASRPPGPAPGGAPGVTGSHGVLVSRLDVGVGRLHGPDPGGLVQFSEAYADHRASEDLRSGSSRLCARRLRRGVLAVFAHPLLSLIGAEYADASTNALRVLTVGLVPFPCVAVLQRAMPGVRAGAGGIVAGLALAGAICLASVWAAPRGSTALAIAWVTTSSLGAVWAAWRLSRRAGRMTEVAASSPDARDRQEAAATGAGPRARCLRAGLRGRGRVVGRRGRPDRPRTCRARGRPDAGLLGGDGGAEPRLRALPRASGRPVAATHLVAGLVLLLYGPAGVLGEVPRNAVAWRHRHRGGHGRRRLRPAHRRVLQLARLSPRWPPSSRPPACRPCRWRPGRRWRTSRCGRWGWPPRSADSRGTRTPSCCRCGSS